MWFITKNFFDFIMTSNMSKSKKSDLIHSNIRRIKKEINKLSSRQIVNYFFSSKIPSELKKIMSNEINNLELKKDDNSKQKIKDLIKEFTAVNCHKEKYIRSDTFPDIFKKIIIDNVYGNDCVKVILNKSVSKELKKNIIRLNFTVDDVIKTLNRDISTDMEDYILDMCLKDGISIRRVIEDKSISKRLREKIIIRLITIDNIFQVLAYSYDETIEVILKLKSKELTEYLNSLTYKNILDVINDYNIPRKFLDYIYESKYDVIIQAIDKANKETVKNTIFKERNEKIVKIMLERKSKVLYKIINGLWDFQLLSWLNLKYLPQEYKNYIINKHKSKVITVINRLDTYDIRNYLKTDSFMPASVQEIILEKGKEKLLADLDKKSDTDLITTLKYNSFIKPLKKVIVEEKININNIFDFLNDSYLDREILELILDTKKDIIKEYFSSYDIEELFRLKIKKISKDVLNELLKVCEDIIREKCKGIDEDELIDYIEDDSVHKIVKYIILEEYYADEYDVINILTLIDLYDTKLILDNYEDIKKFIELAGIDFNLFLQYGSGSKKYSGWLDKLLEIFFDGKTEDFIKGKEYFFDNYYDISNENDIYIISCFLEYLNNYTKYQELITNISNDLVILSNEDKLNISFLFTTNFSSKYECPSELSKLSAFKLDVYQNYKNQINSGRSSLSWMQKIFNEVLFCGAQNLLEYIGGTGALRTLKKDNINSISISKLIDELMVLSSMIEMVNDTNNREGLNNVLNYIFNDAKVLNNIQNTFKDFEKTITRLYELDSNNNLSRIVDARNIEGCLCTEKCEEYGGEVFDFSDKNYCLYGHILSVKEKIEDIINGVATGKSNFISVSPVSYRGQKYYWDRNSVIIAYDYVPYGNFICSSISNMGTNYKISSNSSEVGDINRIQRGILETSAVIDKNAEALLYRNGLKPCGLILPGNRKPSKKEIEIHNKYGLPFIITQDIKESIDDPKYVFSNDLEIGFKERNIDEIRSILEMLRPNVTLKKEDNVYTGREVAVFADCHSMYEPALAVLEDIRRRGIDEIYSLGDNVGLGPNPTEVFDLLEDYGVVSVAGNAEYYNTLGVESFPYLTDAKLDNQLWTERKLGQLRISKLKAYPASIDLVVGNKKFALCHFANDIRWDFRDRSVYTYYKGSINSKSSEQFKYTNSDEAIKKVTNCIVSNKNNVSIIRGYVSSKCEPLFGGKVVTSYDCILQGHVHFEIDDRLDNTDIFTLRAVSMGFTGTEEVNNACYYVLRERKDGDVDIEKVYVPFNRNALLSSIHTCDLPSKDRVLSYVKKSR